MKRTSIPKNCCWPSCGCPTKSNSAEVLCEEERKEDRAALVSAATDIGRMLRWFPAWALAFMAVSLGRAPRTRPVPPLREFSRGGTSQGGEAEK